MSIEDIKDINKLKQMLKSAIEENKYLKECCIKAGEELAKHSFEWDGKEKNLIVQAMELNEKYEQLKAEKEKYKQTLQEIKKIAKCSIDTQCEKCPMEYSCEELCTEANNLQTIIIQKCEVLKDE